MRAKIRQILEECIETGIESGYLKAHKHNDSPYAFHIYEQIENAIWLEVDQRFDFERNVCDEVVEGFDHLEKEREWVGLTDGEITDCWVWANSREGEDSGAPTGQNAFARAIEAKLKEKNT